MHKPTQESAETATFIGLLVLVTAAFFVLLLGLFEPILWAAIFALLFRPINVYFAGLFHNRLNLAALVTLLLVLLFVVIPTFLIGTAVVKEGAAILEDLQAQEFDPAAPFLWLEQQLPAVQEFTDAMGLDWDELRASMSEMAVTGSQLLASKAFVLGQNAVRTTLLTFVMLYLLFFLLRDGEKIVAAVLHALPLGDERERFLVRKMAEVLRATVKGTLVIGLIQGTLGGLIFAALGIRAAVLWGVVMAVFSILPLIGSPVIWLPAALILAAGGHWIKAGILIVFGTLVISLIDNLMRPKLVGRDTKMPDYLVLLSTLGGLSLFGLSGFVIGPMIAAVFLACWALYEREFHQEESIGF